MADRTIETVGLIGLGKMGGPMARHMVNHGYRVIGYDIDPELVDAAGHDGTVRADSPAVVAGECELCLIAVGFDTEVEQVVFGAQGLLENPRESLIIGVASTIAPATMERIVGTAATAPVRFLDCPLTRGEQAAIEGKMLTMVGGDVADFDACRPVMECYADAIFHVGGVGAGSVGKMVNNMILWACMSANREGVQLAKALDVDPEVLREALLQSSAGNWSMQTRADEQPTPWAEKDMMIVLAEADRLRLSLPLAGLVKEVIKQLKFERGYSTPAIPHTN